ncbi:hypothetical protein [Sulfobacillus harzensis]|uniref:Uncharacterized protein n=1 Tax=Sulfobacillus harzensis TaxID=2729629 RepID=A0A7Y0L469_9FIRM|nr:hypothetical protein [Sulfobacillus harzensis]NMP22080.1 hypothetical protein [Sulfobacillus harzensis]
MKNRWLYAVYALIALAAVAIGVERSRSPKAPTTPVAWHTQNPVLSPPSHPLPLGSSWVAKTRSINLPKSQLATAEWFWPITRSSSVSYILHDGRARWVVDGHSYTLKNPPDDPNDQFVASRNGTMLGWTIPGGGAEVMAARGTSRVISHAQAMALTANGQPVWLLESGQVVDNGHLLPWHVPGVAANTHSFIHQATTIISDNHGTLDATLIPSGQVRTLARVRQERWPILLTARAVGNGVALELERPTAIPRYLIIWVNGTSVRWYRFASPNPPEVGVFQNHLVVENLSQEKGNLAVLTPKAIHPLNVTASLFSQSAEGIIWPGPSHFVALYKTLPS